MVNKNVEEFIQSLMAGVEAKYVKDDYVEVQDAIHVGAKRLRSQVEGLDIELVSN